MRCKPWLAVLLSLHTPAYFCRDLKPENLAFTSDMCLKLCDLGIAINLREERAVTRADTLVRTLVVDSAAHAWLGDGMV